MNALLPRPLSHPTRWSLMLGSLLALLMLGLSLWTHQRQTEQLRAQSGLALQSLAAVAVQLARDVPGADAAGLARLQALLPQRAGEAGLVLQIVDGRGALVGGVEAAPDHGSPWHPAPAELLVPGEPAPRMLRWPDGRERLSTARPWPAATAARGGASAWLLLGQDLGPAEALLRADTLERLLAGLLGSALLVALLHRQARRSLGELAQLATAAHRLEQGSLDTPLPASPASSREVQALTEALERMRHRLHGRCMDLEAQLREREAALEEAQAELAHLSQIDPLTRLLNRRGLQPRLQQALALTQRHRGALSLLLIDIDHFKQVNERHGRAAGDRILQALAEQLRSGFRAADIVARLGGEEFLVVLTDNGSHRAQRIAQALIDSVALREQPEASRITLSVGVAGTDAVGFDGEALIHAADQALYEAKRGGRNRVACYPMPSTPERTGTPAAKALVEAAAPTPTA